MGLLGGTALLMYGLDRMSGALKRVAAGRLRQTLHSLTRHRLRGFLTGVGVTALTQSSTLVTVTLVGLATAGLLTLEQSIPVILGANIGTTITAQLIAFNIAGQALWIVGAGYFASMLGRWPRLQLAGEAGLGLGLMFLGLFTLTRVMTPLQQLPAVHQAFARLDNPLLALLAGAVLAAAIHSSAGVIGLVIALTSEHLLSLPAAIAIGLGAEVGTCATALLSSIGRGVPARRVALAQLLFNVIGAGVTLPFVRQLGELTSALSGNPGRQVANAMSLFNVVWAVAFLGLTPWLAGLVKRLAPEAPEDRRPLLPPQFLSPEYLTDAELAFTMVRRELGRIGAELEPLLAELPQRLAHLQPHSLARVRQLRADVDTLSDQIASYLGQISQQDLPAAGAAQFLGLIRASNGLHHIMDLLADLLEDVEADNVALPRAVLDYAAPLQQSVLADLRLALSAISTEDVAAAQRVSDHKESLADQVQALRLKAASALNSGAGPAGGNPGADFELSYAQLMNLLEHLKRIHYYARRSARTILKDDGPDEAPPAEATSAGQAPPVR
jgi:phosphate:Na+ symporter